MHHTHPILRFSRRRYRCILRTGDNRQNTMDHQESLLLVEDRPSSPSFEPIGFFTRPEAVFEASSPDDYHERQARRLLARRNAIAGIPQQPRVHQRRDPAPGMPRPTEDLFRNTSLEEPARSRAPPAPAPFPDHELTEAEMDAQDRHHIALMNMGRQRTLDKERAARADRYADRLDAIRVLEKEVLAVYKHALFEWKASKPTELTFFLDHVRNASTAASSGARIWDIVGWFPGTPKQVGIALRAVQKHYHLQAAAQVELRRIEEKCEGWSSRGDLDGEILTAAEHDKKVQQMGGQGNRAIFGLNLHFNDIGTFTNCFTKPGQEKSRLLYVLANLKIRETLLRNTVAHMPKVKPRYAHNLVGGAPAFKFADSVDCDMIHWCCTALDIIQYQIKPTLVANSALWKLAKQVHDATISFVNPLDTINLRNTITKVKAELLPLLKEIDKWSTSIEEEYDSADFIRNFQMLTNAKGLSDQMLQYEKEHGEDILGTSWKPMVEEVMGGFGDQVYGSGSPLEA